MAMAGAVVLSFGQGVNPVTAKLTKAGQVLKAGDLAAAEQILTQVLKAEPGQPSALNLLGLVRIQQKRPEEAQDLFRKALKSDPKFASPYSNLGLLYKDRGETAEAIKMFRKAVELAPRDPVVLYNMAIFEAETGNFAAAIARLKAIPAKDRPPDCWQIFTGMCIAGGDYARAEESLRQELARNPESIATLRQLAGVALKRNDGEAAWKYMLQARRLAPNSPELLYEYAQVSLANRLATEAIVAMRKAVLIEPDRPEYLLSLGKALMESPMESNDALLFFLRYVKLKPEDPEGHGALGWAYYTQKDYVNARREVEESLRLQPDQMIGYYQLGAIAFETGENARALELLKKFLQTNPDHADAHLTLGMVCTREARYEDARGEFEAVARLRPNEPRAHYQLSQVYRRLGDMEAAAREAERYQEAMKVFRESNERSLSTPSATQPARKPGKK